MTKEEAILAYLQKEYYLTISIDFEPLVRKTVNEIDGIEILDELWINDSVLVLKLKCVIGAWDIFSLGALVHINKMAEEFKESAFEASLSTILSKEPIKE